jgi:hypothetical protein
MSVSARIGTMAEYFVKAMLVMLDVDAVFLSWEHSQATIDAVLLMNAHKRLKVGVQKMFYFRPDNAYVVNVNTPRVEEIDVWIYVLPEEGQFFVMPRHVARMYKRPIWAPRHRNRPDLAVLEVYRNRWETIFDMADLRPTARQAEQIRYAKHLSDFRFRRPLDRAPRHDAAALLELPLNDGVPF